MANQIRITPETMRQRAGEYRTQRDTLNEVLNKLDSLLTTLQSEWEGEASRAYAEEFERLRPAFTQAIEMTDTISQNLDKIAIATEAQDIDIANQLRG